MAKSQKAQARSDERTVSLCRSTLVDFLQEQATNLRKRNDECSTFGMLQVANPLLPMSRSEKSFEAGSCPAPAAVREAACSDGK